MALMRIPEKYKKLDPKIWIASYVLISAFLLYWYPPVQVSHFEINNATINATLENQYRSTLAQILGGGAVAIGIYFAWNNFKISQDNLNVSREGQITERFTRAIDQLGNEKMEIRLGGVYALGRIANESEKDYWPIMEILTAYIRKNSSVEDQDVVIQEKVSFDIQAVLTVLGKRENPSNCVEENRLNLQETYLQKVDLKEANLERANLLKANLKKASLHKVNFQNTILYWANLEEADLQNAILQGAHLADANLQNARLYWANLEEADLEKTDFQRASLLGVNLEKASLREANLRGANLKGAILYWTNLEGVDLRETNFEEANLEEANLEEADLQGAKNLTIDQLSEVKTLYNAKLDKELEIPLREKYPALFEKPDQE